VEVGGDEHERSTKKEEPHLSATVHRHHEEDLSAKDETVQIASGPKRRSSCVYAIEFGISSTLDSRCKIATDLGPLDLLDRACPWFFDSFIASLGTFHSPGRKVLSVDTFLLKILGSATRITASVGLGMEWH
jgi:hypothetical protein